MFKAIQKSKARKGFTLVELIVVISIIAILMLILVPSLLSFLGKARTTKAEANAKTAYNAVVACYADHEGGFSDGASLVSQAKSDKLFDNSWEVSAALADGTVSYVVWAEDKDTLGAATPTTKNGDTDGKWARWPQDKTLN